MMILDILLRPGAGETHYVRPTQFPITVCGEVCDYSLLDEAHAAVRDRGRPVCRACRQWMTDLVGWAP